MLYFYFALFLPFFSACFSIKCVRLIFFIYLSITQNCMCDKCEKRFCCVCWSWKCMIRKNKYANKQYDRTHIFFACFRYIFLSIDKSIQCALANTAYKKRWNWIINNHDCDNRFDGQSSNDLISLWKYLIAVMTTTSWMEFFNFNTEVLLITHMI